MENKNIFIREKFYREVLELILAKLENSPEKRVSIHPNELFSLASPSLSLDLLHNYLFSLKEKGIIGEINYTGAVYKYFYLDKINKEKLFQELEVIDKEINKKQHGKDISTEEDKFLQGIERYIEKEGKCYLVGIAEKEIEIGRVNTRKCKLLKSLFELPGKAKAIDTVFGNIQLLKDRTNPDLWDEYLGKGRRVSIIKNTAKEIQRILSRYKSKRRLKFHIKDRKIWLEII